MPFDFIKCGINFNCLEFKRMKTNVPFYEITLVER